MKNEYGAECYTQRGDVMGFDAVDLPFYGEVSLATATQFTIGMFFIEHGVSAGRIFVGIEGHGAYTFSARTHANYVAEKLRLGETDAKSVADFITGQFGVHKQFQDNIMERFL